MGFVARLNFPTNSPPCRAYVHTAGFEEVYFGDTSKAADYLLFVLQDHRLGMGTFRQSDFLLAAIWGSGLYKTADIFGLNDSGSEKWSGNPDVSAWVFKDGVYVPDAQITCGDTLIMLGREEEFRRTTKSLEEYCTGYPHLGVMEPDLTFTKVGGILIER